MSFLNDVRLVFSGRFQADVSTVNNDVRHFDNATFEPDFQKFSEGRKLNGWWNPTGSGAFRLLNCAIVAVHYDDGTGTTDAASDPAVGMRIAGSDDRTSGKIVDIDPQWQLASVLWGLEVRLSDDREPNFFSGRYEPHAFRDLWFGRMTGGQGDSGAAATFQSVLTDVIWAKDFKGSRALAELQKAAAATRRLSIRLTTFSYVTDSKSKDFTLGTVIGVIGPHLPDEPESFVLGRRFAPASGTASWNGCSYCTARVDRTKKKLFLDLSNALQLVAPPAPVGIVSDIGALTVGVLKDPEVLEFAPATAKNFLPIGELDYRKPGWLFASSGVAVLPLDDAQLALASDHPLALAALNDLDAGRGMNGEFGQIAMRETTDGLFVEAEPLVHRIDAPGPGEATIRAARYGVPIANAEIIVSQLGRLPNQGGSGDPNFPPAKIEDIGVPEDKFHLPALVTTDANGNARLGFAADDPGNPRKYIDGQLYLIDFRLPGQGNQARSRFDYIVVHVRDRYDAPADPSWKDVEPIFVQYRNLYPIMSQIVDLANPADVKRHAKILRLAFGLQIGDANHMPVTRDLSRPKGDMILAFLDKLISRGDADFELAIAGAATRPRPERIQAPPEGTDQPGGKTLAARGFNRALGLPGPD